MLARGRGRAGRPVRPRRGDVPVRDRPAAVPVRRSAGELLSHARDRRRRRIRGTCGRTCRRAGRPDRPAARQGSGRPAANGARGLRCPDPARPGAPRSWPGAPAGRPATLVGRDGSSPGWSAGGSGPARARAGWRWSPAAPGGGKSSLARARDRRPAEDAPGPDRQVRPGRPGAAGADAERGRALPAYRDGSPGRGPGRGGAAAPRRRRRAAPACSGRCHPRWRCCSTRPPVRRGPPRAVRGRGGRRSWPRLARQAGGLLLLLDDMQWLDAGQPRRPAPARRRARRRAAAGPGHRPGTTRPAPRRWRASRPTWDPGWTRACTSARWTTRRPARLLSAYLAGVGGQRGRHGRAGRPRPAATRSRSWSTCTPSSTPAPCGRRGAPGSWTTTGCDASTSRPTCSTWYWPASTGSAREATTLLTAAAALGTTFDAAELAERVPEPTRSPAWPRRSTGACSQRRRPRRTPSSTTASGRRCWPPCRPAQVRALHQRIARCWPALRVAATTPRPSTPWPGTTPWARPTRRRNWSTPPAGPPAGSRSPSTRRRRRCPSWRPPTAVAEAAGHRPGQPVPRGARASRTCAPAGSPRRREQLESALAHRGGAGTPGRAAAAARPRAAHRLGAEPTSLECVRQGLAALGRPMPRNRLLLGRGHGRRSWPAWLVTGDRRPAARPAAGARARTTAACTSCCAAPGPPPPRRTSTTPRACRTTSCPSGTNGTGPGARSTWPSSRSTASWAGLLRLRRRRERIFGRALAMATDARRSPGCTRTPRGSRRRPGRMAAGGQRRRVGRRRRGAPALAGAWTTTSTRQSTRCLGLLVARVRGARRSPGCERVRARMTGHQPATLDVIARHGHRPARPDRRGCRRRLPATRWTSAGQPQPLVDSGALQIAVEQDELGEPFDGRGRGAAPAEPDAGRRQFDEIGVPFVYEALGRLAAGPSARPSRLGAARARGPAARQMARRPRPARLPPGRRGRPGRGSAGDHAGALKMLGRAEERWYAWTRRCSHTRRPGSGPGRCAASARPAQADQHARVALLLAGRPRLGASGPLGPDRVRR